MKNLLYTFSLLFLFTIDIHAQFNYIGSPKEAFVIDVQKVNNRLFSILYTSIFYSDDNGASWTLLKGSNQHGVISEASIHEDVIFAVFSELDSSKIMKTEDFGSTWQKLPVNRNYSPIFYNGKEKTLFYNDNKVFVEDYDSIYISTDKGNTFTKSIDCSYSRNIPVVNIGEKYYFNSQKGISVTEDFVNQTIILNNNNFDYFTLFRNESSVYLSALNLSQDTFALFKIEGNQLKKLPSPGFIFFEFYSYLKDTVYYYSQNSGGNVDMIILNDSTTNFKNIDLDDYHNDVISVIENEAFSFNFTKWSKLFTQHIYDNASSKDISNNIKGSASNLEYLDGTLWAKNRPLSYYDENEKTWKTIASDFMHDRYAILSKNEFATFNGSFPFNNRIFIYDSLGNQSSEIIPPLHEPNRPFQDMFNFNKMLYVTELEYVHTSFDKGNTWKSFNIPYSNRQGASYSNGYHFIIDQDKNKIWFTSEGIAWDSVDASSVNTYIRKVFADNVGNIYLPDYDRLAKYDRQTSTWSYINLPDEYLDYTFNFDFPPPFVFYENAIVLGLIGEGIYITYNNGESWELINEGLDNLNVIDMITVNDKLYVSTFCNIYERNLSDINAQNYNGVVFEDENNNGMKEPTENYLKNIKVKTSANNIVTATDINGAWKIFTREIQNNTVSIVLPEHCTATNGPIVLEENTQPLGMKYNKIINDVGIKIIDIDIQRPGFTCQILLDVNNYSYANKIANITLVKDSRIEYLSSDINPSNIFADSISWSAMEIAGLDSKKIMLKFRIPNTVLINSFLKYTARITINNSIDDKLENNNDAIDVRVLGSYDPNDKASIPAENIGLKSNEMYNGEIVYKIRFQNTGNYPAEFVKIIDTIDQKYDLRTINIIGSSHKMEWKIKEGNVLEMYFPNINLLDSFSNEALSHGFAIYSLKVKKEYGNIGETIKNTAYIYFDYNDPVITNTVKTSFQLSTLTQDISKSLLFNLYPQPSDKYIIISIADKSTVTEVDNVSIYDQKGSVISQFKNYLLGSKIDISNLASGAYNVYINHSNGVEMKPFIKL